MVRRVLAILLAATWWVGGAVTPAHGAAALAPGELAVITVNADDPEGFDCVPLVSLDAGTVLSFTDNAWSNGAWRGNEGLVTYTATAAVAAGTVLAYRGTNENGFSRSGSFDLSAAGDTLLVFQGAVTNPVFLFGVGWAQASPWIVDSDPGSAASYVPEALSSEDNTLLSLGAKDDYQYLASAGTVGTRAEWLARLGHPGSWTGSNDSAFAPFTPAWTVLTGDVTNPAAFHAAGGDGEVVLTWTPNEAGDPVLLAGATNDAFGFPPGSAGVGDLLPGGGLVLCVTAAPGWVHTGLVNGVRRYYHAWSVRDGTNYSEGVSADAVPVAPELATPQALPAGDLATHGFTARWTLVPHATGYRLDVATNAAFRGNGTGGPVATLAPGQAVLVTVNAVQPKGFDFIPLVDLASNTVVKFSDRAWSNTLWSSTEGVVTFTAPADIPAGMVLAYRDTNENGFVKTGSFNLSGSGDTLLVYQGDDAAPAFLYGVGWAVATPWVTNGPTGSNRSYPPAALDAAGGTLLALGTRDNYQYRAEQGTAAARRQLFAWIGDAAHWRDDDTNGFAAFSFPLDVADNGNDYVPGYRDRGVAGGAAGVTGLLPRTAYYYRVQAVGADATSVWSGVISVVTPGETPAPAYSNWAAAHGLDPQADGGRSEDNFDGDPWNNGEEFVADTDPTNAAAFFPPWITNQAPARVIILTAGPPTTNSRQYDVWLATNMIEGRWHCLELGRPGAVDGGGVTFTLTNVLPAAVYRTGVRLPH